jgi:GNAT superfamily N-acetyltransferase
MSGSNELRLERYPASLPGREEFTQVAVRMHGKEIDADPLSTRAECLMVWRGEEPVARCTLLEVEGMYGAHGRSGLIGHYEAVDGEAGVRILTEACRRLADDGVARVLGPMNGSTWLRYRLALPSEPGDPIQNPPFFPGEPRNPFEYPQHFLEAGFEVAARYESRLDDDLTTEAADAVTLRQSIESRGIRVRPLDLTRFDEELSRLYDLSVIAFAGNLYYSPIDSTSFKQLYEPARSLIDPALVLMAEDAGGSLVSFFFSYADPSSVVDGRPVRLVAKTIATAPAHRGIGLGRHLFDLMATTARERGYAAILHALAHTDNMSMKISKRHGGRLFRRYALYQWTP